MAHHKSALKRIKQNERQRMRNKMVKANVRSRIREVREAVAADEKEKAAAGLSEAVSKLNRAASKGVIPKKRAARLASRLSKAVEGLK